jgi:Fe2+ transport system protein FeoA
MPPTAAPVSSFQTGESLLIHFLGVSKEVAIRLRQLGVREGCQASVVSNGDKCVLAVGQARIALRREVAMCLFATCCEAGGSVS